MASLKLGNSYQVLTAVTRARDAANSARAPVQKAGEAAEQAPRSRSLLVPVELFGSDPFAACWQAGNPPSPAFVADVTQAISSLNPSVQRYLAEQKLKFLLCQSSTDVSQRYADTPAFTTCLFPRDRKIVISETLSHPERGETIRTLDYLREGGVDMGTVVRHEVGHAFDELRHQGELSGTDSYRSTFDDELNAMNRGARAEYLGKIQEEVRENIFGQTVRGYREGGAEIISALVGGGRMGPRFMAIHFPRTMELARTDLKSRNVI